MSKAKKIFRLSGLHCVSCSMTIEGELEDIGVAAKCNYARQVVEVEFDPGKVGEKEIIAAIQNSGYKVTGSD